MKKTLRNIIFISALSPLLIQCASQDEVKRLQYQLHVVNKKLEDMKSTTVGDIQKRQAASSSQMDQLEREILFLKNQLEETNHLNRRLKEQNKELETNIGTVAKEEAERREEALRKIEAEQQAREARIAELTEKLKIQQDSLQAIQDARVRDAERRAKEARLKADAAKAKALAAGSSLNSSTGNVVHISPVNNKRVVTGSFDQSPSTTSDSSSPQAEKTVAAPPQASNTPTAAPSTETDVATAPVKSSGSSFDAAQQMFQQKDFGGAYSAFDKIAAANPASEEGISAGYMMGECLFAQKEYDKAILQYQKIISQNGSHPKAASATLKQAMAFELLADKETAKMIYKKLLNHYGSSPEAKIAKDKLATL